MTLLTCLLILCAQGDAAPVDFAMEIRPILSDRCFLCHGPGDTAEIGGFRLDVREGATEDLGGWTPIVPGDPGASEVMVRLRHKRGRKRMPPPKSKLEISEAEIALLERWILEGAPYAEHWAFVPPRRSPSPEVLRKDWARDPLDSRVLAQLEAAGLQPTPETDRASWLRRVSFDLTGLPPTLDELDAFAKSTDASAHELEVDRLLASPRHAERMATPWLDAARYADTYGYQSDVDRTVWPWRDWVIDSYAKNQPYDEFLTWQLAGDLLPNATREQRLATTFNRLHRQTNEGGSTEQEYRLEYVADRVQTVATAVLGLTMECARCHDHKFDPITQEEFYGLASFFDDIDESGLYSHFTDAVPTPALDLPTEEQEALGVQLEEAVRDAERLLAESGYPAGAIGLERGLQGRFRFDRLEALPAPEDETARKDRLANDANAELDGLIRGEPRLVEGYVGQALEFSGDDPAHFPGIGQFQRSDPFSIGLRLWLPRSYERAVVLHRSRAWTDSGSRGYELLIEDGRASAALIHFWPGDAVRVRTREPLPLERWVHVTMTWDGSGRAAGLRLFVDGQAAEVEVIRDHLQRTILGGGIEHLTLGERFRDRGFAGGRVDDLAIYARELSAPEVAALVLDPEVREGSVAPDGQRAALLERVHTARRARDEARDRVMQIMTMAASGPQRTMHVLERGSYLFPAQAVEARTPAMLSPFPQGLPSDRLGLARWLTNRDHPLTARVEVNRTWQLIFGSGLVSTPEDFGSQGDPPSHPDLLDELALDFVESGWDRQALLKRLVLSATYRQGSLQSEAAREVDPDNRLLSHSPRKRLSAEMLRDGALFSAGLLVEKRGGPPVKPYQPAGLWKEKSGKVYQPDSGEGLWRRSLYTFWKRTSPPPAMMILNAAKRDVCVVKRASTGSPLQALLVWNDPQYVEAARKLAALCMKQTDSKRQVAEQVFRTLTSRFPAERELEILLALQEEQRAAFASQPEEARALVNVGSAPLDSDLEFVELASWTILVQVVQSFDAALSTP